MGLELGLGLGSGLRLGSGSGLGLGLGLGFTRDVGQASLHHRHVILFVRCKD